MATDYIEKYVNNIGSGWCQHYVLIAIVEDEDGDQSFFVQTPQEQTAAATLGLCEAVAHIQKAKIAKAWINKENETDE